MIKPLMLKFIYTEITILKNRNDLYYAFVWELKKDIIKF